MFDELKKKFINGSILIKLMFIVIVTFVAMWFISLFFRNPEVFKSFESWFALPGSLKTLIYKPWTVVSYMFMHGDLWHLLMNMILLFWFGSIFIKFFSEKQFLAVFLLGGFSGAALHLFIDLFLHLNIGIIGASAAVMAVVFAISIYKPDYIINLLLIGPVKIKYIAIVAFALDIMGAVGNFNSSFAIGDGIAHTAHLGGAFFGLWFGYEIKKNKDITAKFNNIINELVSMYNSFFKKKEKKKNRNNRFEKPRSNNEHIEYEAEADDNDKINKILDKISKSGYDSLSKSEKEFLFKQKEK